MDKYERFRGPHVGRRGGPGARRAGPGADAREMPRPAGRRGVCGRPPGSAGRARLMGSLGRRDMNEFVEPHVRRLVAERLGVGVEELVADVSLRDDLAADSLDLVELAMALEGEFAIVVPEHILDEVRTYSDLVRATSLLIRASCEAEARGAEPPERIWVRIVPAAGGSSGTLHRTGGLRPYTAETIAEDAVGAGRGARLEVTVAASSTTGLVRVQHHF